MSPLSLNSLNNGSWVTFWVFSIILAINSNFWEVFSLNLMWFDKFGFHGYSSYWKLDIIKQWMSDWPSNDRKNASHSNLKLIFSERFLDLVRCFQFGFDVIWEIWLPWLLIWLKIGRCKARNIRLVGKQQKNDFIQLFQGNVF